MKHKKLRCPKCKGTSFSLKCIAFQDWDSEEDEWYDIEFEELIEDDETYFCKNCSSKFKDISELEEFK